MNSIWLKDWTHYFVIVRNRWLYICLISFLSKHYIFDLSQIFITYKSLFKAPFHAYVQHDGFVLFYIAAVYKRDIYYPFLMVDRNMFGTKSSSKCNCILSRRITFPWINMLNKMKICKWIIVAVAENGMREVYHCKLFAWFSFALHLKIKQRNSWYERIVYHYYQ